MIEGVAQPVAAVRARMGDSRHPLSGTDHPARIRSENARRGITRANGERGTARHRYPAADHRSSLGSPRRERIARTYRPARRPEGRHLACDDPLLLLRQGRARPGSGRTRPRLLDPPDGGHRPRPRLAAGEARDRRDLDGGTCYARRDASARPTAVPKRVERGPAHGHGGRVRALARGLHRAVPAVG